MIIVSILKEKSIDFIIENIVTAYNRGIEIILIPGGGNIIRGIDVKIAGIKPTTAHYMGMLATVVNSLALRDILISRGCDVEVFSAFSNHTCSPYDTHKAHLALKVKKLVIIAGGTGRAHATTDTASVLAAVELKADAIVKGTKVDGVYSSDPNKNPDARYLSFVTYDEALIKQISVMDLQAFALAKENCIKIIVGRFEASPDSFLNMITGEQKRSLVS